MADEKHPSEEDMIALSRAALDALNRGQTDRADKLSNLVHGLTQAREKQTKKK